MTEHKVSIPKEQIAESCRRNHVRRLSLFGSVLRGDFGPDSDVDVLVEFEPAHVPAFALSRMERGLSELLGRKVDLRTPQCLSRYFNGEVLVEVEAQYAEE